MVRTVAPSNRRGLIYIAIAGMAWGTGGAVAAVLFRNTGLDSVAVSFWRLAGGAAWLALTWPLLRRLPVERSALLARQLASAPLRLALTGAGLAIYQLAYFAAVGLVGVAVSTVVALGAGPVLIAVGARIWLAERLGRRGVVTLAVALVGLVLLVLGGGGAAGSSSVLGTGLAVLSALGYAATTLLSRAMTTGSGGSDPVGNALLGFAIGACALLPFAVWAGLWPTAGNPVVSATLLAYLGLVPTALAYGLFYVGLTSVSATTASVVALTESLLAALIGVLLLHEPLTSLAVAGGVLLLGAVVARALHERRTTVR
ncbi:MAG TPA: DMT family transporter [Kribbella sp.]|nr:DMT family transporter [Kribbella sp.]